MTANYVASSTSEAAPAWSVTHHEGNVPLRTSQGGIAGRITDSALFQSLTNDRAVSQMIEVPFMAATTLDNVVADPGDRAIQQNRKMIREALGLPQVARHSLGHNGSFSLDPTAVLLAFVARARWTNQDIVTPYRDMFLSSGLAELVHSSAYAQYVSVTVDRVRAECRARSVGDFGPGLVNAIARQQLLFADETALEVASCFSLALRRFADTHSEVDRIPGHIVRIDGPEAIIVLETPERDELHRVEADYLERFGLNQAESAFVLHRQKWTPDTTVGMYIPAVRCTDESDIDEAMLRSSEQPLPSLDDPTSERVSDTYDLMTRQILSLAAVPVSTLPFAIMRRLNERRSLNLGLEQDVSEAGRGVCMIRSCGETLAAVARIGGAKQLSAPL